VAVGVAAPFLATVAVLLLSPAVAAPQEPPPAAVGYERPVDAAVAVAFEPPAGPYGPGNRGLEFATADGEVVRAAAAGTVTFAGAVAGERYVTVLHADRLRTTYGRLRAVDVAVGDPVGQGTPVGTATSRFIWTARLGSAYVDPAVLLAASGHPVVRLVADGRRAPSSGAREPAPAPPLGPVPAWAARWALGRASG
jgi:hypothetical protein